MVMHLKNERKKKRCFWQITNSTTIFEDVKEWVFTSRYGCVIKIIFLLPIKAYALGTQKNCLGDKVLLSIRSQS